MATIYDVAKKAGVSPKTVSRVINGNRHVREETKNKVLEAIRLLDYYPHAIAKSLKQKFTNNVGYVVPYGSDFVFRDPGQLEQLKGAHNVLTGEDYNLILSVPNSGREALFEVNRLLKHKEVDGLILYAMEGVEILAREFEEKGLPYVSLGKCYPEQEYNFVEIDAPSGGYLATKYLLGLGHRWIGFIAEPVRFLAPAKESMIAGCMKAYEEADLEFPRHLVLEGDYTVNFAEQAAGWFLSKDPRPTAIFCASDPMAWGLMRGLRKEGLTPGVEMDIMAGDDLPFSRAIEPELSAVNSRLHELGAEAAEMLLVILRKKREMGIMPMIPGRYLRSELVIRGTATGRSVQRETAGLRR
jgi:LacI family transcriptional regulator